MSNIPQSRILVSLMLPRIDNLNETIESANFQIKRRCEKMSNVEIISHGNIEINKNSIFNDAKHLNFQGILLFAKNLKNTMYHGTKSRHVNGQNLQLHAPQQHPRMLYQSPLENYRNRYQGSSQHISRSTPMQPMTSYSFPSNSTLTPAIRSPYTCYTQPANTSGMPIDFPVAKPPNSQQVTQPTHNESFLNSLSGKC